MWFALFALGALAFVVGLSTLEESKNKKGVPITKPEPMPAGGMSPPQPAPASGWPTPLSDYEVLFQKALADAGGSQHLPYRAMFIQSHLETGGGTSRVLRDWHNGFGFHGDVGAPNRFWDGTHQTTAEGEVMRVYKSLDLSIGDYIRLIQAKYPLCVQAAETGDIKGYFAGLVSGGYATDPDYYKNLVARYKAVYGADA